METPLHPPLPVQQPERVPRLPAAAPGGVLYQAKLDGWRMLAFVDADGVTLQARSQRIVTYRFPEIPPALAALPAGTVLDGEAVAIRDGVFDFHALAAPPKGRSWHQPSTGGQARWRHPFSRCVHRFGIDFQRDVVAPAGCIVRRSSAGRDLDASA